jgi:hypothetical protein
MSARKRSKSKIPPKKHKHISHSRARATVTTTTRKTNLVKTLFATTTTLKSNRSLSPALLYIKRILSDKKIMRTIIKIGILYIASFIFLALSIRNIAKWQIHGSNIVQSSAQSNNSVIISRIFNIDGHIVDSNEWHQAIQTAFSARASAGLYQGGNLADTYAINNTAFHLIADPIALQEIAAKEGIQTKNLSPDTIQSLLIQQDSISFQVSDSEVYQFYVTHPEQFARYAPQVHVREMVLPSSQIANGAISQLAQGASFESVESKFDINNQFYKSKGGDVGWITLGFSGFPPEWDAYALQLTQPGQTSQPFMLVTNYYILQCIDSPDYEVAPFGTDTQERAKNDLIRSKLDSLLDKK